MHNHNHNHNHNHLNAVVHVCMCACVQRIDLSLLRRAPGPAGDAFASVRVTRAELVGQKPAPGTEGSEGPGMLDQNPPSPMYASDHRGLLVELQR